MKIAIVGVVVLAGLMFLMLGGEVDYPEVDSREVDAQSLFRAAEAFLEESESWPAELSDGTVVVSSSLDAHPVRSVRYQFEVEAPIEKAIELIRYENHSGSSRRFKDDKYEDTLYENGPHNWVRRAVHLVPPPGGNRDAVVLYHEDTSDPKAYRIAFQSVETIEGEPPPEVEGAVRFHVFPSMYKIEEIAPGRVRVRKVESVDPRGAMGPWMNNHVISKLFFRKYMFQQAKAMRNVLQAKG